jgi:transcriptional regulator with XRE-family HTH domain
MSATNTKKIHEGRNVKRIREILGIKQDALALDLNLSQQAISQLEQKESIDPALLEEISKALKVPVEAIKNFDEEAAVNVISNTFNSHDHSTLNAVNPYCSFNPIDKIVELYEALVKSEKEKNELLQKMLEAKK